MMAQAGATFNKRGPAPANSEAGPSVRAMDARSAAVELRGTLDPGTS